MFILFDPVRTRHDLLPLTYTRTIADCRVGIMTIREKWEHHLSEKTLSLSEPYLKAKFLFPAVSAYSTSERAGGDVSHIYINGAVLPDTALVAQIKSISEGQVLIDETGIIAYHDTKPQINYENLEAIALSATRIHDSGTVRRLNFPHDIFRLNGAEIVSDFALLTQGRTSQPISATNVLLGDPS